MATKNGSGGGFFEPSAQTPVAGTQYTTPTVPRRNDEEEGEGADALPLDPSPGAMLDEIAGIMLIDRTFAHADWEVVAAKLRRYLETRQASTATELSMWQQVYSSASALLRSASYPWGTLGQSEPVVMYGRVSDTDLSAVTYAAGGGFRSAEANFVPLDDED